MRKKLPSVRVLRLWLMEVGVKTSGLTTYWINATLLVLTLFCGSRVAQGQNACINPKFPGSFSVDKIRACVNSPINVVGVPGTIINAQYNFDYDGKSSIGQVALSSTKAHTYTAPGSYTIIQSGQGNGTGTGTILCQEVTVLPIDPVKFTVKTCSGRRAIMVPDASTLGQYDKYELYWGDGVREVKTRAEMANELSHTYTNAGTYTGLTIQGIYNPPADCRSTISTFGPITVTGTATQPIISSLKTTSDNSIDIDYQAGTGISVQLYQKVNGAYVATGQNGTSSGTFTVQTDAKQVQCFEVVTQDACNTTGLKSDEVCSLVLDVKSANKQNNVSWQPYAGTATQFRFYRIKRNGTVNGQVTNINTSTYSDASGIACGVQYCYSMEATVGPTTITSAAVCTTGINSDLPGNLGSIVVSIENNHPVLIVELPATGTSSSYSLIVSRASGGSSTYQPIATVVNQNSFIDQSVDPTTGSYCYEVSYVSSCGLTSAPSPPVCTVFLGSTSAKGIDWTAGSPFSPQTVGNYIIEVIDSVNNTRREITNIGVNTHRDLDDADLDSQSQKYRVITVSADGSISYSNFFTFRREAKIWVPDAFTPDNDQNGMNETFVVKGIYFDKFRMTIFDRWGEVIYTTTDRNQGWDGKINGQVAMRGQYIYHIEVIDTSGQKTVRNGAVLLIR